MNQPKSLIFADVDGIVTPCRKIFHCALKGLGEDIRWYKEFSDRDSWAMLHLKDELVFISNDDRNRHYAQYKGHKFCYARPSVDKYDVLLQDWNSRLDSEEIDGVKDKPIYIYFGDSPFDYQCLVNAKFGFIPVDADPMLIAKLSSERKLEKKASLGKVCLLKREGGSGCICEGLLRIYGNGSHLQEPWLKNSKVFSAIERFVGQS